MKALIITPYLLSPIRSLADLSEYDLIVCADSAYLAAETEHIIPHMIIGDFDHGTGVMPKQHDHVTVVPCEKDDTDTMLCLKYAIVGGCQEITILGGIGGRLDHTFANLQALAYAQHEGIFAKLVTDSDEAFFVTDSVCLPRRKEAWYLSVFAYDALCEGVTIRGTKYEVENMTLCNHFPLGVSNEIVADVAEISVKKGRILVISSKKE